MVKKLRNIFILFSLAFSDPNDDDYNLKFEESYEMNARSALKIKSEFVKPALKKLAKVEKHRMNILRMKTRKNLKTNVRKNVQTESKITYVGVHNRRTDHIKFMREREKREPLDESFFVFGLEYFRYVGKLK